LACLRRRVSKIDGIKEESNDDIEARLKKICPDLERAEKAVIRAKGMR